MQPDRHALFRLLAVNGLAGGLLGIGFVIGILVLDVARIGTMLATSGDWLVPVSLLAMGSIVTFASVAMGGAIMLLPREADPEGDAGPRPGLPQRAVQLATIRRRN
ncbi:MAG: hypothetical protein O9308_09600 [Beijerinckiaceae bacterium]|nr:hypothetical protein [Beijerinckiaceae bacterium]